MLMQYNINTKKSKERSSMNANTIINDSMTLEEKMKAIDAAMILAAEKFNRDNGRSIDAPVDPADLTVCEGCQ